MAFICNAISLHNNYSCSFSSSPIVATKMSNNPFLKNITLLIILSIVLMTVLKVNCDWVGISRPCLCQEFRCNNGTFCLHKARVCNGYKDCLDGEDEQGYKDKSCFKKAKCNLQKEFKCKFGGCIPLKSVCDGQIDCFGGVDEASDFCAWVHGSSNETAHAPSAFI